MRVDKDPNLWSCLIDLVVLFKMTVLTGPSVLEIRQPGYSKVGNIYRENRDLADGAMVLMQCKINNAAPIIWIPEFQAKRTKYKEMVRFYPEFIAMISGQAPEIHVPEGKAKKGYSGDVTNPRLYGVYAAQPEFLKMCGAVHFSMFNPEVQDAIEMIN